MRMHILHQPGEQHYADHKRASIAYKGQWYADDGQSLHGHAYVYNNMGGYDHGSSQRQIGTEAVSGQKCGSAITEDKATKQNEQNYAAYKASLLSDD